METDDLRKAARCILLATEASVATDLQERLEWAATRIEALEAEVARLKAQLAELRETVESILCLAVEGPEACGYLETVTAIAKKASEAARRWPENER
jgi:hypothetical protein